jgi:hypothetical protein
VRNGPISDPAPPAVRDLIALGDCSLSSAIDEYKNIWPRLAAQREQELRACMFIDR